MATLTKNSLNTSATSWLSDTIFSPSCKIILLLELQDFFEKYGFIILQKSLDLLPPMQRS